MSKASLKVYQRGFDEGIRLCFCSTGSFKDDFAHFGKRFRTGGILCPNDDRYLSFGKRRGHACDELTGLIDRKAAGSFMLRAVGAFEKYALIGIAFIDFDFFSLIRGWFPLDPSVS